MEGRGLDYRHKIGRRLTITEGAVTSMDRLGWNRSRRRGL